ncbi:MULTISPECIES: hypothetical protein [unclassified Bradyrhizobium]|uniref:hypothetical protein n=1 Tax=unclassified Bradyrhizobium TaxID=2631580 RepID=UPI002446A14B|nr:MULTISPECIES: hypothetical protein [unclassified Bradyrhizobium]MDH2344169.1 hypothetical protein [Bradyrhizobium sp. SSUT77]MDH2356135.1 hypothetical protein [Bradyrhizobium sp. SSUT112]
MVKLQNASLLVGAREFGRVSLEADDVMRRHVLSKLSKRPPMRLDRAGLYVSGDGNVDEMNLRCWDRCEHEYNESAAE